MNQDRLSCDQVKTFTSKKTDYLVLSKSQMPKDFYAQSQIKELVNKLLALENVSHVRAIFSNSADQHWIDFQVEISSEKVSHELWRKMQHLVIEYEWKLRDETKEDWYFDVDHSESLGSLYKDITIIADCKLQETQSLYSHFSSSYLVKSTYKLYSLAT